MDGLARVPEGGEGEGVLAVTHIRERGMQKANGAIGRREEGAERLQEEGRLNPSPSKEKQEGVLGIVVHL